MDIGSLLTDAAERFADRVAVTNGADNLTFAQLERQGRAAAARLTRTGRRHVLFHAVSSPAFAIAFTGAVHAGIPFVPLSYRLGQTQLDAQLAPLSDPLVVTTTPECFPALPAETVFTPAQWCRATAEAGPVGASSVPAGSTGEGSTGEGSTGEGSIGEGSIGDGSVPDGSIRDGSICDSTVAAGDGAGAGAGEIAVLLYTSGTTAAPKSAVLRHRHLVAAGRPPTSGRDAGADESVLMSLPPYHVAGIITLLGNLHAGRRIVYLNDFTAQGWLDIIRRESITHALVVPTMLQRIVDRLLATGEPAPPLRALAYGGSAAPADLLVTALRLFPRTRFSNGYGSTETSSTIALLGPAEHRAAISSDDPAHRSRLSSAGRLLPGIELQVRDEGGAVLPAGQVGALWVRGDQVAGEYAAGDSRDPEGWFAIRDRGRVDDEGYLFLAGRTDDVIIRGGENVAPAEVEEVIAAHPAVAEVVVVGPPDPVWGQRIVAIVVPAAGAEVTPTQLVEWARARLRSAKAPQEVRFRSELPRTEMGKLVRRDLIAELAADDAHGPPA